MIAAQVLFAEPASLLDSFDLGDPSGRSAAHHGGHEVGLGNVFYSAAQHLPTIAKHAHAIADVVDLLEGVRDVEHSDAAFAQSTDALEQPLHGSFLEPRRRFVEDEKASADGQCAGDLHHLRL